LLHVDFVVRHLPRVVYMMSSFLGHCQKQPTYRHNLIKFRFVTAFCLFFFLAPPCPQICFFYLAPSTRLSSSLFVFGFFFKYCIISHTPHPPRPPDTRYFSWMGLSSNYHVFFVLMCCLPLCFPIPVTPLAMSKFPLPTTLASPPHNWRFYDIICFFLSPPFSTSL